MKYNSLDARVFAVGFYDGEGVWFYTWERDQEQDYCYALAAGEGELIARFTRPGHVYGEAKLADVISGGLPE